MRFLLVRTLVARTGSSCPDAHALERARRAVFLSRARHEPGFLAAAAAALPLRDKARAWAPVLLAGAGGVLVLFVSALSNPVLLALLLMPVVFGLSMSLAWLPSRSGEAQSILKGEKDERGELVFSTQRPDLLEAVRWLRGDFASPEDEHLRAWLEWGAAHAGDRVLSDLARAMGDEGAIRVLATVETARSSRRAGARDLTFSPEARELLGRAVEILSPPAWRRPWTPGASCACRSASPGPTKTTASRPSPPSGRSGRAKTKDLPEGRSSIRSLRDIMEVSWLTGTGSRSSCMRTARGAMRRS